MPDFVGALRANRIFPQGGYNPFQAPVDNGINMDEIRNLISLSQGPIQAGRDAQNAQSIDMQGRAQMANQQAQMTARARAAMDRDNAAWTGTHTNTIFAPNLGAGIDPYKSAQLGLKARDLDIKGQAAGLRDQNADEDRAIRQQRADVYGGMHDLSDSDKAAQNAQNIINRMLMAGTNQMNVQGLRGDQRTGQIDQQGNITRDVQAMKGDQAISQIDERGSQQRQTNADKPTKAQTPSEQRVQQYLNARRLITENPELGQFIHVGDNGAFDVDIPGTGFGGFGRSGPDNDQLAKINEAIYGTKPNAIMSGGRPILFGAYNSDPRFQTAQGAQTGSSQQPNGTTASKYQVAIK